MRRGLLILSMMMLAGCGDPPPDPPRVPVASVVGSGTIRGRVRLDGPAPAAAVVRNEPCCPGAPATQLDESVVVGTDAGLANVFVYLDGGARTDGSALPAPLLDQKFCQYVPHAIGVVVGQPLTVRSSDATFHNVNIRPESEPAQNFAMQSAGEARTTHFERPGFVPTKCDVHAWMSATIGVFDNSFFAVTRADGSFAIKGVPDGDYTLIARHERFGTLRRAVSIKGGRAVAGVDLSYHPPTP